MRQLGRTDRLAAAAEAQINDSALDAFEAVEAADLMHRRANAARSNALAGRDIDRGDEPVDTSGIDELDHAARDDDADDVDGDVEPADQGRPRLAVVADPVSPATVDAALGGLRGLRDALAGGAAVDRYTAGSIRLLCTKVLEHLDGAAPATIRETNTA